VASESLVRVVTDGSVAVSPESIARLNIGIVPCQVVVGRQNMTSDSQTPLALLSAQIKKSGGARIALPQYTDFLKVYRDLQQGTMVSIHGAPELGGCGKSARLARNLLPVRSQVALFEAPTVGPGLSFLVEAAAGAAERGANQRAVQLMLERIREEALRTIILVRNASDLVGRLGLRGWRSRVLPVIPGSEVLFAVTPTTGRLQFVAQGFGVGNTLAQRGDLFRGLGHVCDVVVVHSGYERLAQKLVHQLPALLGGGPARVEMAGPDMTPYLSGNYLAILVYPTVQAAEQLEKFARRMVRVFAK